MGSRFKPEGSDCEFLELIDHLATRTAKASPPGRNQMALGQSPITSAVYPLTPGLGLPSALIGHPAQVRSSNITIRSGSRTQ
jgi:hypothetical protein